MKTDALIHLIKLWPKPIALVIGLFLCAGLFFWLKTYISIDLSAWFALVSALILIGIWFYSRRLRNCPAGKYGFIIAISIDDEKTEKLFKKDFANNIKKLLTSGSLGEAVWVYQIPQLHLVEELTKVEAGNILKKTNSNFIIYGQVRTRGTEGNKKHYLDLSAIIAHAEAGADNQNKLINEFSELLPRRIIVDDQEALPTFELTSAISAVVAKYVAGVAIFFSGNYDIAEAMYEDARQLAEPFSENHETAIKICQRIPLRKTEIIIAKSTIIYNQWKLSRDPQLLENMGYLLTETPEEGREFSHWKSLQAIHLISSQDGNVDQVEQLMLKENAADPVVQVNLAFFDLLRGNLKAATRHYREAQRLSLTLETVEEIFDFMEWYVTFNSNRKAEMHFAIGYVSLIVLNDKQLARDSFAQFREYRQGKYDAEDKLIDSWLTQ